MAGAETTVERLRQCSCYSNLLNRFSSMIVATTNTPVASRAHRSKHCGTGFNAICCLMMPVPWRPTLAKQCWLAIKPRPSDSPAYFRTELLQQSKRTSNAAAEDGKIRRRILQQIGTPRAGEELAALKCALKGRDVLASLSARLPLQIGNLANDQLDECKALIESAAARDGELFLYALLTVMNRMTAPWQLIRLGVKAAGSDTAARVAETHYGVAVNIVLAELERMVAELRDDLRSGQGIAVGSLLKTIHDATRGLRTELALPVDSTWGRALAAQRIQISDLLRTEIESMPSRVRRLLRPRPSQEIRPNLVLDSNEVAAVEALVEFVGICRYFAGELAINEMTQRALTELRQYLDNGTRARLEGLRQAGEADRSFRQSQVDAAVRFCAKVFGREYAALLVKAAEVAGTAETKAARA